MKNEIQVFSRILFLRLIIFQMPANAALLRRDLKKFGNAQRSVIKRLTMTGVRHFIRLVQPARGEDQHSSRVQSLAEFFENRLLLIERNMPDAIPGGDEVEVLGKRPRDDVGLVKRNVRVTRSGEVQHRCGNVQPFDGEPVFEKQIDESPAAATTDIDRLATLRHKPNRPQMLLDPIITVKRGSTPMFGDGVVARGGFLGRHWGAPRWR